MSQSCERAGSPTPLCERPYSWRIIKMFEAWVHFRKDGHVRAGAIHLFHLFVDLELSKPQGAIQTALLLLWCSTTLPRHSTPLPRSTITPTIPPPQFLLNAALFYGPTLNSF